jgi:hypothetical protein
MTSRKNDQNYRRLYQNWVKYLRDTNLTPEQIHLRASQMAERGINPF